MKTKLSLIILVILLFFLFLSCGSSFRRKNIVGIANSSSSIQWVWWSEENTIGRTLQENAVNYFLMRHGDFSVSDILYAEPGFAYRKENSELFWFKRLQPGETLFLIILDLPKDTNLDEYISKHLVMMDTVSLFQSHPAMRMLKGNVYSYRYDTVVIHANRNAPGSCYTNK